MCGETKSVEIFIIEAFTVGGINTENGTYKTRTIETSSSIGTGNPAAVCLLQYDDDISDEAKQKIAATVNSNATAFVSMAWTRSKHMPETGSELANRVDDSLDLRESKPKSLKNEEEVKEGEVIQLKRTIRWFTPKKELPLCGHGTLASTKAILTQLLTDFKDQVQKTMNENELSNKKEFGKSIRIVQVEFQSKFRGILKAAATIKKTGNQITEESITLNFPGNETINIDFTNPTASTRSWLPTITRLLMGPSFILGKRLSQKYQTEGQGQDQNQDEEQQVQPLDFVEDIQYAPSEKILLFRLKHLHSQLKGGEGKYEHPAETLAKIKPDFQMLMKTNAGDMGAVNFIVTIAGTNENKTETYNDTEERNPDFYSRFFAPAYGINEDPVTGTAHTILVPYWTRVLRKESRELYARQSSSRGGDLYCQVITEDEPGLGQRVSLSGTARILVRGQLSV